MRKWAALRLAAKVFNFAVCVSLVCLVFLETGVFTALALIMLIIKLGPFITVTINRTEERRSLFDRSEIKPLNIGNVNGYLIRKRPVN